MEIINCSQTAKMTEREKHVEYNRDWRLNNCVEEKAPVDQLNWMTRTPVNSVPFQQCDDLASSRHSCICKYI